MHSLLAQIDLPSLGQEGPDDVRDLLDLFYWLFGVGFLIGILGQLVGSRLLRGAGIAMVMVGTFAFLLAVSAEG